MLNRIRLPNLTLWFIFLFLLVVPSLIQGNNYFVGGDDLKLYYLFPEKYLENYVFNIISDNTLAGAKTGYYPVSEFAPFLYVILFFKKLVPFLNTQYLLYGLNYAFGFLFFYLFLGLWIREKSGISSIVKILAALFYVLSPFLMSTIYNHKLLPFYLISVIPIAFYCVTKAVIEKKVYLSVLAALVYVTFSMTLNNMPWVVSFLIVSTPYILFLFIRNPKYFLINAFILILFFVLLNTHSVYHLINSQFFVKGLAGTLDFYSSEEFKAENIRGIFGVSRAFSPLSQPLLVFDNENFQKVSLVTFVNLIFLALIVTAGILVSKLKDFQNKFIFLLFLFCLSISWFCFSPNFGNWGPVLFMNVMTKLPFMTMFRNMFDKFAIPMAFYFALSYGLALSIVSGFVKKRIMHFLFIGLLLITLLNARPFFKYKEIHEGNRVTVTGEFNDDFNNLLDYFSHLKTESTIMWIPLTAPNYVSVEDKHLAGHYYSGLSPIRILAGKSDYAGRFAFILPIDLFRGDKLISLIKEKKYEEFGYEIRKLNVGYLVVDHQKFPDSMQSFLYDRDLKYLNMQTDDFKKEILGGEIAEFGSRYTLYNINEKFANDKIYLTDKISEFSAEPDNLSYEKLSSSKYKVKISNLSEPKNLVFLDPFYREWNLSFDDGPREVSTVQNTVAFDYANNWELDPGYIRANFNKESFSENPDGSLNLDLNLIFEPDGVSERLKQITLASYILAISILFYSFIRFFINNR